MVGTKTSQVGDERRCPHRPAEPRMGQTPLTTGNRSHCDDGLCVRAKRVFDRLRDEYGLPTANLAFRGVPPRLCGRKQIVEELRGRVGSRYEEPITSTRARHVEQVALRVVDLLEIGFVDNALDPGLKREDLVVATGDDYSPELEALGEVHGSDRDGSSGPAWSRTQGLPPQILHPRRP